MTKKRIYLDFAASTPLRAEVKEAMEPFWSDKFGNASGIHMEGRQANQAIEDARSKIAEIIDSRADEIVFTSGGTEGNNIVVLGLVRSLEERGFLIKDLHFITTNVEHSSVRDCFIYLEKKGASVTYVPVNKEGIVSAKDVSYSIKDNTVLVSIMYANNEIGSIQPIAEIGELLLGIKKKRETLPLYFHSDASQVPTFLDCNVRKLNTDLLTLDGQKIYGPKGIGLLYIKNKVKISPIFCGGKQEFGMRVGTPNTPLIVGFSKALELAEKEREESIKSISKIQRYFMERLKEKIPKAELNGSINMRMPNNIHISIPGYEGEFLVIALDKKGIAATTRSACLGRGSGSYVVEALGKSKEHSIGSIRFSLGKETTKEEVDRTVEVLAELVRN